MKLLTQWAAAASALILVVLAVRHLCRNRLSARLNYALWAVVLVRLLAPFQLPLLPASAQAADLLSNMAGQADRQMVYAIPEQVFTTAMLFALSSPVTVSISRLRNFELIGTCSRRGSAYLYFPVEPVTLISPSSRISREIVAWVTM